jgi:hypothetical protein
MTPTVVTDGENVLMSSEAKGISAMVSSAGENERIQEQHIIGIVSLLHDVPTRGIPPHAEASVTASAPHSIA